MRTVDNGTSAATGGLTRIAARMPWPLLVVLIAGAGLRVVTMWVYQPSVLQWVDGIRFTRISPTGLFDDYWMPAGYPVFLAILHWISRNLIFTIAVQHLVGLAGGLVAYLVVRRLGGSQLLACIPAAAVVLSGDSLYLEHILMADFLVTVMSLVALYAAVRATRSAHRLAWLTAAGVLTAVNGLVRSPALAMAVAVVIWLLIVGPGGLRGRGTAVLAFTLPFFIVVGAYASLATHVGKYSGLGDLTGWNLYPRVAPFADCTKFQPPPGTQALCQYSTPPSRRPAPYYYVWDAQSVSRRDFPVTQATSKKLEAFAILAIVHQPLDYLEAVGTDLVRFVDFRFGGVPFGAGESASTVSFSTKQPALEQSLAHIYARKYTDTQPHLRRGIGWLQRYDNVVRVPGWMLPILLLIAGLGVGLGSGPMRQGALLFGLSSLVVFVVPVAVLTYDYRYGIPPTALLVVAGVLGFGALWVRVRGLRAAPDRVLEAAARGRKPHSGAGTATARPRSAVGPVSVGPAGPRHQDGH